MKITLVTSIMKSRHQSLEKKEEKIIKLEYPSKENNKKKI